MKSFDLGLCTHRACYLHRLMHTCCYSKRNENTALWCPTSLEEYQRRLGPILLCPIFPVSAVTEREIIEKKRKYDPPL